MPVGPRQRGLGLVGPQPHLAGEAPVPRRVAVASSGGRDSTALLHCTVRQTHALGIEVLALHVHHGLMPQADAWLAHVRAQARRWGAGFDSRRLGGAPAAGDSIEAWARRGRYAALAEMAQDASCDLVLLAHHRRDQAETVLLQALRGAGAAGLAAMPGVARRDGITWARPWLHLPREAIEAYVRRHRLRHVDDPSNADDALTRSRLRRQVWPALAAAFPQAEAGLRHTALRLADERTLLDEVAAADLAAVAVQALATGWASAAVDSLALSRLSHPRQRHALRLWLRQVQPLPVPETLVRRLVDELPHTAHAGWPGPQGRVLLRRGRLTWEAGPTEAAEAAEGAEAADNAAIDVTSSVAPGRAAVAD